MTARRSRTPGHGKRSTSRTPSLIEIQGAVSKLAREIETLREHSDLHDQEIDGLQVQVAEKSIPWYRSVNSLIPILALLFSLTTFLISAQWSATQNEQDARAELRTLLQRLYQLDTREGEILASGNTSSGELENIYSEMGFLARQAMEAADRVNGGLSSAEYRLMATYLARDGDNTNAAPMYQASIDAATTLTDYANARRAYGLFLMDTGHLEEGREQFGLAVRAGERFPTEDESYLAAQQADIEVTWAQTELAYGQCDEAGQHFRNAEDLIVNNQGPSTAVWRQNLQEMMQGWEDQVQGCRTSNE